MRCVKRTPVCSALGPAKSKADDIVDSSSSRLVVTRQPNRGSMAPTEYAAEVLYECGRGAPGGFLVVVVNLIKIRRKRRRKGRFSEILSRFRRLIVSSLHSARLARAARTRAVCGAHIARPETGRGYVTYVRRASSRQSLGTSRGPTGRFALPRMHAKGQNFFSIIVF